MWPEEEEDELLGLEREIRANEESARRYRLIARSLTGGNARTVLAEARKLEERVKELNVKLAGYGGLTEPRWKAPLYQPVRLPQGAQPPVSIQYVGPIPKASVPPVETIPLVFFPGRKLW